MIIPFNWTNLDNSTFLKQIIINFCSTDSFCVWIEVQMHKLPKSAWVIVPRSFGITKSLQHWIGGKNLLLHCDTLLNCAEESTFRFGRQISQQNFCGFCFAWAALPWDDHWANTQLLGSALKKLIQWQLRNFK